MQYYFILGSNPVLSIAELSAKLKFEQKQVKLGFGVLFVTLEKEIDTQRLIRELGGTIKIGEVVANGKRDDRALVELLNELAKPKETGKYCFGFSSYLRNFNPKPVGMTFKTLLKEKGVNARWVVSREATLSSVVVEQNKLISNGWDINLFEVNGEVYVGRTLAVQPFKELSKRDYGRPARDDHSGMLPPKLAQIMINLANGKVDETLLDPFCGSGTVLSEAMLMGYKNLLGSDLSEKAVEDTITNLAWTAKDRDFGKVESKVIKLSATELSSKYKAGSVSAIATEPFLGPQRGQVDIRQVVSELETLYSKSINEFVKILKPGARVCMVWPIFKTKQDRIFMSSKIAGQLKVIPAIPEWLLGGEIKLTNRKTIVYGREGQKVWREIVILEK